MAPAEPLAPPAPPADPAPKDEPSRARKGYLRIVNVGHENVGGYDFNDDGKIDVNERFDALPGSTIELTEKRARMLLKETTVGKFLLEAEGLALLKTRAAEEAARKAAEEKKRARVAAASA